MNPLIHKILQDVDADIREALLETDGSHARWEYLNDPALTALTWQLVRNNKRHEQSE